MTDIDDVPPWEDGETPEQKADRIFADHNLGSHEAIKKVIMSLARTVHLQGIELYNLQKVIESLSAKPARAMPDGRPQPDDDHPEPGVVTRGKYRGRKTADVIASDPWYIQWMLREKIPPGNFGFSEVEIEIAKNDDRPEPKRR